MIFACASSPLSAPYSAGTGGLSGGIVITAPCVFEGGICTSGSLSFTDGIEITAVLSESGRLEVTAPFTDAFSGSIALYACLSAMNGKSAEEKISNSLSPEGFLKLCSQLSEALAGNALIRLTLGDFGSGNSSEISIPLNKSGLAGSLRISLPQSTGAVMKDSLAVYADGRDVTPQMKTAEISLFGENNPMSFKAEFKNMPSVPDSLSFEINGTRYDFCVDKAVIEGTSASLSGEMGRNHEKTYAAGFIRASELAAQTDSIIFSADDFMVQNITGSLTDFDLAVLMAENSGRNARQMPGGRTLIYGEPATVYQPDNIISVSSERETVGVASAEVIYGQNGDDYTALEPSVRQTRTGRTITLKVYGAPGAKISANGGTVKQTASGQKETFAEDILFQNGTGRLSRPAETVHTYGVRAEGKKLYSETSTGFVTVSYTSGYSVYEISSDTPADISISVSMENRAVVFSGVSGTSETIYAPHICDYVTAVRTAEKFLESKGEKILITAPHSGLINTTSAISIKSRYGSGKLTGAKIQIQGSPLKIIDEMEVLKWQK